MGQRPWGTSTVDCVVVLLSESASLTARETLTVLGMRGVRADVLATHALTIGQFSRWRRRSIPAPLPSHDPLGYLAVVRRLITSGDYEAVLATHEQAWLFAAGRSLLPQDAPIAVASMRRSIGWRARSISRRFSMNSIYRSRSGGWPGIARRRFRTLTG